MLKYQFILHSKECGNFVEQLRELGMVDITTTGWEPSQSDRELILEIEALNKARKMFEEFGEVDKTATPYKSGDEAIASYKALMARYAEYDSQIAQLEKSRDDAAAWGDFSAEVLEKLEIEGIKLTYFTATESEYEAITAQRDDLTLSVVNEIDGKVYFVVVSREGEEVDLNIDAQMLRPLTISAKDAESKIEELKSQKASHNAELSRLALSSEAFDTFEEATTEKLQLSKLSNSAEQAAEGSLLVMEGWAEEAKAKEVESVLNGVDGLYYIKSNPTREDNTPVKLENNRFAKLFELVGNLYALPKYGTIDLTPFFAPFYMLFFAICLCDAGYGAIILLAGLGLYFKGGAAMRQAAWFTILCGSAAVIFGFLAGSFLGMSLGGMKLFEGFKFINFQKDFFSISMMIGIVQILFGMLINIFVTTRTFGIKYAFGSIGWFMIIFSNVVAGGLSMAGISGFEFGSLPYYIALGIGAALLLFLNSPEKNIFANLGAGVWEAYDRTTGLMSDVLSYIRLFAIGLSGGVLALVFNDLAIGMTGLDQSWADQSILSLIVKILAASALLLLGHGINLFMSTISSFVHPMRLTFVEFYKNAGFEMGTRKFEPISKK